MAFGIPSKSSKEFSYDLNRNQIMGLSLFTFEKLGWSVFMGGEDSLLAEKYIEELAEGYVIEITAEPQKIFVKSSSEKSDRDKWEINEKNVTLFIETFNELKEIYTNEDLSGKFAAFREQLEEAAKQPKASFKERLTEFISYFIPTKEYFATPLLALINIVVFIVMIVSGVHFFEPDTADIIKWGGNFAPKTLTGEWWRLLTACFVHIGIFHLALNMIALIYVGAILEGLIGRVLFIFSYLLAGLSSSVVSMFFHTNNVSAGASGAIFGMFGVLLVLLLTNYGDKRLRASFLGSVAFFVIANLAYGMKDGIDNAGHIGGLIGGALIGLTIYPLLIKPREPKFIYRAISVIGAVFIGLCAFATTFVSSNDIVKYETLMEEFAALENEAIDMANNMSEIPDDSLTIYIDTKGIKKWERCLEITKEAQGLSISRDLKKRCQILEQYSTYRFESFKILKKAVEENTNVYDAQMLDYNNKIDSLFKENK